MMRDPMADRLAEELRARSRGLPPGRPDLADVVVARGRQARARRRLAGVAGSLVAVVAVTATGLELGAHSMGTANPPAAIRDGSTATSAARSTPATPSGLATGGGQAPTRSPRAKASSSASSPQQTTTRPTPSATGGTRTSAATAGRGIVALAATDLPAGPPPAVPYVAAGRLHDGNSSLALHLPHGLGAVTAVARLGTGWVVAADVTASDGSTGPGSAVLVTPDASVQRLIYGSRTVSGIAGAPDGGSVLVVDDGANGGRSTLTLVTPASATSASATASGAATSEAGAPAPVPVAGRWRPVGFLDATRVLLANEDQTATPAGRVWDTSSGSFVADLSGRPTGAGSGLIGLWNGRRTDSQQGVCSDLVREPASSAAPVRLASSCSWQPVAASDDGQRVLAVPSVLSGAGPSALALTGRNLKPLVELRGEFEGGAWAFEPDGSVLLVVSGQAQSRAAYAVVRCRPSGRCERASDLVKASDSDPVPLVLGS